MSEEKDECVIATEVSIKKYDTINSLTVHSPSPCHTFPVTNGSLGYYPFFFSGVIGLKEADAHWVLWRTFSTSIENAAAQNLRWKCPTL